MKKIVSFFALLLAVALFIAACAPGAPAETPTETPTPQGDATLSPEDLLESLRGTTVTFYGWGGGHHINEWLDNIVASSLYENYGIILQRVGMDIGDILSKLIGERQAGVERGDIDVVWINGENFYTALNANLLYGPITHRVPNFARYLDPNDPDNL
jgi:putative spermidine/putrescine transport system substrate-binding protein